MKGQEQVTDINSKLIYFYNIIRKINVWEGYLQGREAGSENLNYCGQMGRDVPLLEGIDINTTGR